MSPAAISPFVDQLFGIAQARYPAEREAWVDLSWRLAGRFNLVMAAPDIQRQGDLDVLLRCLEDEFSTGEQRHMTSHYQMMFSETWIVGCYEILRAFQQRDREAKEAGKPTSGVSDLDEFKSIFTDLELLRMPIAKYEIAKDRNLMQPLPMRRFGVDNSKPINNYDRDDPNRLHIMPKGVSSRGSAVWLALDLRNYTERWIERRDVADRLLKLVELVKGAGELEAEERAAAEATVRKAAEASDGKTRNE